MTLWTLLAALGCSDDDSADSAAPETGRYAGCTKVIKAGSDAEAIQTALIEAKTKSVLCFADGVYKLDRELSSSVNDITVRGNPDDRRAVVLDYTDQVEGKDALSASGSGFTVEHLSVKNSHGNAIVVKNTERVSFRDLYVSWEVGSATTNGAYAVYPLSCHDVLVEDCEVIGASDAGVYVGQSENIIVRNNTVHGNVTGIEIENSDDALVTSNHVYDNTAGILVFVLPNLERKSGARTLVEENKIEDNNRANFGAKGTTVSVAPSGVGILVLANDGTEIRNNTFTGNKSTGVLAISFSTYETICAVGGGEGCVSTDSKTDRDLSKLYIHDNTFEGNGHEPDEVVASLFTAPIENVLWDGRKPANATGEDQLCLGPNGASVRMFGGQDGFNEKRSQDVTDAKMFACTLPAPFSEIKLPQDT
jgi:parallel beta-helix repeat protein